MNNNIYWRHFFRQRFWRSKVKISSSKKPSLNAFIKYSIELLTVASVKISRYCYDYLSFELTFVSVMESECNIGRCEVRDEVDERFVSSESEADSSRTRVANCSYSRALNAICIIFRIGQLIVFFVKLKLTANFSSSVYKDCEQRNGCMSNPTLYLIFVSSPS